MYYYDYLCVDDMGWGILFILFIKVIKFWYRDLIKINDINWLLLFIFIIKEIINYLFISILEN